MMTMFDTHKVIIDNKQFDLFLCDGNYDKKKSFWVFKSKQNSLCIATKVGGPLWVDTYRPSSTPYLSQVNTTSLVMPPLTWIVSVNSPSPLFEPINNNTFYKYFIHICFFPNFKYLLLLHALYSLYLKV